MAVTYPLVLRLGSAVGGFAGQEDPLAFVWFEWWFAKALVGLGINPAHLTHINWPLEPYHPIVTAEPYVGLVGLPLTTAFGPVVAYNVQIILAFALAGFSAYLLCLYLTRHRLAAFVGGAAYAFFANNGGEAAAGHLPNVTIHWLPLYGLCLLRLLRRPTRRNALLCGAVLSLALTVKLDHIGHFLIPFSLWFVVYYALADRQRLGQGRFWLGWGAAGLLAAVVTSPFLLPFARDLAAHPGSYARVGGLVALSPDALSLFVPSAYHPLIGQLGAVGALARRAIPDTQALHDRLVYVGWVALILAGVGLALSEACPERGRRAEGTAIARRRAVFWAVLAGGAMVMALGPVLKFGGQIVEWRGRPLPTPYALVASLPFYGMARTPGRLSKLIMLAVAVLAAYGAAAILARLKNGVIRVGVAVALSALIAVDSLAIFPFPTDTPAVPDVYRQWAADADDFAVLDWPPWHETFFQAMYAQTIHQHRIVTGRFRSTSLPGSGQARYAIMQLISPHPLADVVKYPQPGGDIVAYPLDAGRIETLQALRIRYVAVHDNRRFFWMVGYLQRLLGRPVYEDDTLTIFAVPTGEGRFAPGLPRLRKGWSAPETVAGQPARWMAGESAIEFYRFAEGQGRLAFTVAPVRLRRERSAERQGTRHGQVVVNDAVVGQFAVDGERRVVTDPFPLRRETNVVAFRAVEPCQVPASSGDCVSLRFRDVALLPAAADGGFDLDHEPLLPGARLRVTLYSTAATTVRLVGGDGRPVAESEPRPASDRAVELYELRIPPDAVPGPYWLETVLADDHVLALTTLDVAASLAQVVDVGHPVDVVLGDTVRLLGYDVVRLGAARLSSPKSHDEAPATARPGERVPLALVWQAVGAMDADYTVFTHLVDDAGQVRAQHDSQPVGGAHPTSRWPPGEVVRDRHELALPPDLPPGAYRLKAGMYDLATMERLPVAGAAGGENAVELGSLVVSE